MARSTRPFVSPEAAPGCTSGFMLCPLVSPEACRHVAYRRYTDACVGVCAGSGAGAGGVVWSCRCPASVVLSVEFGVEWEVWVD